MSPKRKNNPEPLNAVDEEWHNEDVSLFGFSTRDIALPTLVIVQPLSRMPEAKKHTGQIYNTVLGEFSDEVELAFIGWNTPRAVLPFPFNVASKQLCASMDSSVPYDKYIGTTIKAKNAYDEMTVTIPETCGDCPLSETSLCTQMFRYFGIQVRDWNDSNQNYPFSMRFKRTALTPARQLNFWLAQNERQRVYTTFKMTVEEVEGENSYFIPHFEVANDASSLFGDAVNLNRELSDRLRRQAEKQLTEVVNSEE